MTHHVRIESTEDGFVINTDVDSIFWAMKFVDADGGEHTRWVTRGYGDGGPPEDHRIYGLLSWIKLSIEKSWNEATFEGPPLPDK